MSNRDRLLHLKDLLFRETDEQHYLTIQEIDEKLAMLTNEHTNVKTLKTDLEVLNGLGFEILELSEGKGYAKRYAHVEKDFEFHEVQMLVDAVASGRFISKRSGEKLTKKLRGLLSAHQAKQVHTELIINPLAKSDVKNFHLYVSRIHEAIAAQKRVRFQYGEYNWQKQFELKHEGTYYSAIPVGVVWQSSYYYLIAFVGDESYPRNFRIDRMRNVEVDSIGFVKTGFDMKKYVGGSLNMFGAGEFVPLTLKCKHSIVKHMIDEFGIDFTTQNVDDEHCLVKVSAKDNAGLVYWLLRWGTAVEVLQPAHIRTAVEEELRKTLAIYSG